MRIVVLLTTWLVICLLATSAAASHAKEDDLDVNYDENKILPYELPPLLVTAEGKTITTPEEWRTIRRPQILSLFANDLYGCVPAPPSPIKTDFEVVKTDAEFMGGTATRKDVRIHFQNDQGEAEMIVLVFTPNKKTESVPALLMHSFDNTRSTNFAADPDAPGKLNNGVPLAQILDSGYAFVVVYQQSLVGHNEVDFQRGIAPLFYHQGQSFPKANEWGVISVIAWGGMRAMDYLETDRDIDAKRVAIMGHSKCGKAALWTGAQDERFALVISAESGCAGAALWRRPFGENMEKMVTRFPNWLCRNAAKYAGRENDLPVDQHMLLALIAPRPVYVYSGEKDTWADARGEYLSAYHASEVYRLLGKTGLASEALPPIGSPVTDGEVGYHIREGGHSIEPFDWEQILRFMDKHLKPK